MSETSFNQDAWVELFEKHKIIQRIDSSGLFTITANQIKEFREPRLMTKFDHAYQLPPIFKENNISILPITRGSYSLGRFNIFHKTEENDDPLINFAFENHFESLSFDNISAEPAAISCIYVSKILEDFLGEKVTPTVSGRMGSGGFQFEITAAENTTKTITVDRAQIEIDAGFESEDSFSILEAKNHFSEDFVIRQIYYPFRKWKATISKPIRNVFLTHSNGVFELREYEFLRINEYNSIQLIQCKKYAICNFQINVQSIQEILSRATIEVEPLDIPFPQADSFDRVINLCELLNSNEYLSKAEITENYGFDIRQTDYYLNACKYLGFVEKQSGNFTLSAKAKAIFLQHIKLRRKFFIEQLLKRRVYNKSLELFFKQAHVPSTEQIVKIMRESNLQNIDTETTYRRRASTVRAWVEWIVNQIEE